MNTIDKKKKKCTLKRYGPGLLVASGLVPDIDFAHKPYPARYKNWLRDTDKVMMERE